MLYDPDRPALTIEEINDAIAEGGAESGMRGHGQLMADARG